MQIVPKLGMLTIVEIEAELMNNFQFLKLRNRNLWRKQTWKIINQ